MQNTKPSLHSTAIRLFTALGFLATAASSWSQDSTPPTVLSATFEGSYNDVIVTFDEPMSISALDPFNYYAGSGLDFESPSSVAQEGPSGSVFRLKFNTPRSFDSELRVQEVYDVAGNLISVNPTTLLIGADVTPPIVTCSVALPSLFPPNGTLHDVGLSIESNDAAASLNVTVESDEPTISGDVVYSDGVLQLRAARDQNGDGRVYLVIVKATDWTGNVATKCVTVVVPHDRSPASVTSVQSQATAASANCSLPAH